MHMLLILLTLCLRKPRVKSHLFSIIYVFAGNGCSHEEFMTRGVGLGILHQGRFVAGASSAAVGGGRLEIEIQTHRQFRRRGLARAVAAALIRA